MGRMGVHIIGGTSGLIVLHIIGLVVWALLNCGLTGGGIALTAGSDGKDELVIFALTAALFSWAGFIAYCLSA